MWKDTKVKNKTLWHITKKDYSESIKEKGILKSKIGQVGPGVYAIIPDLDVLDNLIEFFDLDKKNVPKDLVVVEFTYTGEVVESPVEDFIFIIIIMYFICRKFINVVVSTLSIFLLV